MGALTSEPARAPLLPQSATSWLQRASILSGWRCSLNAPTEVPTLIRTLVAAGFEITDARRQPRAIIVECTRDDAFGDPIPYLIAVTDEDAPPEDDRANIIRDAERDHRRCVLVAAAPGPGWWSWDDFLEVLGGAVSTWRALGPDYPRALTAVAHNELPEGLRGEPWRLHEDAAADGFEFLLGRRVRRLGGLRRGAAVADIVALTPDDHLYLIDAKTSKAPFDVGAPELRPLREYVERQRQRQRGLSPVSGVIVTAAAFVQDDTRLTELSAEFMREARATLCFLTTGVLIHAVGQLTRDPHLRAAIRWSVLLSGPGRLAAETIDAELRAARLERLPRDSI